MGIKLDVNALDKWLQENNYTMAEVSRNIGFGSGALSNCRSRRTMTNYIHKSLEMAYGISPDAFIKKVEITTEPKTEPNCDTTEVQSFANSEVVDVMKEMINEIKLLKSEISKLGNIQMQNMEYLKQIKDNTTTK